jgi:hypothetical protein
VPHLEIEYLDGLPQDSAFGPVEPDQRAHPADGRLSRCLAVVGVLIAIVAVAVSIGLAVTYRSSTGDPLGPPGRYVAEQGVPPAADLVIGTVGLALGLGLISLSRLVANSAAALSQLEAIRLVLAERAGDGGDAGAR